MQTLDRHDAGPSATVRPVTWRRRRARLLLVVGALLLVVAGRAAWAHVEEQRHREPLEVLEQAAVAAAKPIGVVTPGLQDRWFDSNGPREEVVRHLAGPGSDFVEPLFYARYDREFLPGAQERCYFLSVQPGPPPFDAQTVTSLMRVCYLEPDATPYSVSSVSAVPQQTGWHL